MSYFYVFTLKDIIDLTKELGIMVHVFAGLDIVKNVIAWEIQALDPNTGDNSMKSCDFSNQPAKTSMFYQ